MNANWVENAGKFEANDAEIEKRGPYGVLNEIRNARDEVKMAMQLVSVLLDRTDLLPADQIRMVGKLATNIYKIDNHLDKSEQRFDEYFRRNSPDTKGSVNGG